MTQVSKFFAGIEGKQGSGSPPLLPTSTRNGAPPKGLYLLQFVEEETEVRQSGSESKHPNHPYISYKAEVVAPEDFAGRTVYGMFYYPAVPEEPGSEAEMKNIQRQQEQFVGAIDAVLGEGSMAEINGDDLNEALSEIVDLIAGEAFVGKMGVQKARKEDGVEVYPARNRITHFYPASEWEGEARGY